MAWERMGESSPPAAYGCGPHPGSPPAGGGTLDAHWVKSQLAERTVELASWDDRVDGRRGPAGACRLNRFSQPSARPSFTHFCRDRVHLECPSFPRTTCQLGQDPDYRWDPAVRGQLHPGGLGRACEPLERGVWLPPPVTPPSDTPTTFWLHWPSCCSTTSRRAPHLLALCPKCSGQGLCVPSLRSANR